jgi:hypothetical protein
MPRKRHSITPHYDAWRAALRKALAKRGRKVALARHMAAMTGLSTFTWQVNLGRIQRRETIINAEWIAGTAAPRCSTSGIS